MRNAVAKRHIWGGNIHRKRGAQTNHQPGRRPVCTAREMPKVAVASVLKATLVSNWASARERREEILTWTGAGAASSYPGTGPPWCRFWAEVQSSAHAQLCDAGREKGRRKRRERKKNQFLNSWPAGSKAMYMFGQHQATGACVVTVGVVVSSSRKEEVATKHTRQAIRGGKSFAACPARADKIGVRGLETSTIMPVGGLELPSGVRWGPVTPPSVAAPWELDGELCLRCRLRCLAVPSRRGLVEPDYPAPRP